MATLEKDWLPELEQDGGRISCMFYPSESSNCTTVNDPALEPEVIDMSFFPMRAVNCYSCWCLFRVEASRCAGRRANRKSKPHT